MEKIDSLTYTIIGCAMKIQNILGNGFQPQRRRDAKKKQCLTVDSSLCALASLRLKG
jgi:hypothetical protein